MFDTPFYHESIRKYVILVGTLFNDIRITRSDSQGNQTSLLKVPVTYAPRDKMLARVLQDPNIDRQTAVTPLPVISFAIDSMTYDADRKKTTTGQISSRNNTNPNVRNHLYNPVPYNFVFKVNIYAKQVNDGLKIIEQILPYFTPAWTTTVEMIPDIGYNLDVPVVLKDVGYADNYDDGEFKNRRMIVWELTLLLKGELYGPVKTPKIIKFVKVNFRDVTTDKIEVGNTAISEQITVQPGLTANGLPTSSITDTIPYQEIDIDDDFGYVVEINTGSDIV